MDQVLRPDLGRQSENDPRARQEKYAALYRETHHDILRFVGRRLGADIPLSVAEDITADAFLIAWRRFAEIPTDLSDARAWLFGVARKCLLNEKRSAMRRGALQVRIADDAILNANGVFQEPTVASPENHVASRLDFAAAWRQLSPQDQEVIALLTWENLTSEQAGRVLAISAPAFRMRLTRARHNLRKLIQPVADKSSITPIKRVTKNRREFPKTDFVMAGLTRNLSL